MKYFILFLIVLSLFIVRPIQAKMDSSLLVKKGNVYFSLDNKKAIQITKSGQDSSPLLSLDGKKVYFIREGYVTSGKLFSINIDGSGEKFIANANSVQIVEKGRYKGNLIIQQHRYFLVGGSYDWLWLYTPDGKEIGPLGEELDEGQLKELNSD